MKEKERILDKNNMTLELEKMTILQVSENRISRNELSRKRSLQEKGITLIALVVTIIILLILAGVTLNMALSQNGLFSKAKEATEKYKQEQSDEEEMVRQIATQMYSEYVGATVTGYTPEPTSQYKDGYKIEGTKSGLENDNKDDSNNTIEGAETDGSQTFTVDSNIRWRIWDFDGNTLRIIADPTTDKLALEGAKGYNNGVYLMNDICRELYGQYEGNGEMKKGISVSNLKRTDIQKVSTYDYTKCKHQKAGWDEVTGNSTTEEVIQFGDEKTYNNAKYPAMWEESDKSWDYKATGKDKECKTWEEYGDSELEEENPMKSSSSLIKIRESYYMHKYTRNEFISGIYYDIIFGTSRGEDGGGYWLGSRGVILHEDYCAFDLLNISLGKDIANVGGLGMLKSSRV